MGVLALFATLGTFGLWGIGLKNRAKNIVEIHKDFIDQVSISDFLYYNVLIFPIHIIHEKN